VTPEGRVKDAVKRWLREHRIWYFMPVSNGMGVHGIPDVLCCHEGQFVGLEVKAPGKRNNVSAKQEFQMAAIVAAGGKCAVIDNVNQLSGVFHADT
jgi:hypothetical protein